MKQTKNVAELQAIAKRVRREIVQMIGDGGFDFVVLKPRAFGSFVPPADWLTQDGRATQLLADDNNALFRINRAARTTPCS